MFLFNLFVLFFSSTHIHTCSLDIPAQDLHCILFTTKMFCCTRSLVDKASYCIFLVTFFAFIFPGIYFKVLSPKFLAPTLMLTSQSFLAEIIITVANFLSLTADISTSCRSPLQGSTKVELSMVM